MLGQVIVESQNSGAEVFSAIFVIASLGWFIFVIWWMGLYEERDSADSSDDRAPRLRLRSR
jgi:hypothetical protein